MTKHVHFIITGGTIDSVFDTSRDTVVVNDHTSITGYLKETAKPNFRVTHEILTMKDSREITDHIREEILSSIKKAEADHIILTHGTYTMALTMDYLSERLKEMNKTVVLTGSFYPIKGFSPSDAPFNLGFAIASSFLLEPGIYIAMNGEIFTPSSVTKDLVQARFKHDAQG